MTRMHKVLERSIKQNDFTMMAQLGRLDFLHRKLHTTVREGRLVHVKLAA